MRLHICLILASVLYLSGGPCTATAADESSVFYKSLADAVDTANAQANIFFSAGTFATSFGGNPLLWTFSTDSRAKLQFAYSGGVLQNGSVQFIPPARVQIGAMPNCATLDVSSLSYDVAGSMIDHQWTVVQGTGCTQTGLSGPAAAGLEMADTPSSLFQGVPFKTTRAPVQCDATGQNCNGPVPMVLRVQFFPISQGFVSPLPAIQVKLLDHAVLALPGGDQLEVRGGSGFQFALLDYFPPEKVGDGTLRQFQLSLYKGEMHGGGTRFRLTDGAAVQFNNVVFSRDSRQVDMLDGVINASVADGSEIAIGETDADASYIRTAATSTLALSGVRFSLVEGKPSAFAVNGGTLQLKVLRGQIFFTEADFVAFQDTTLDLTLRHSEWQTGRKPKVSGHINRLQTAIVAGALHPNPQSVAKVKSGNIDCSNLDIDTDDPTLVAGDVTQLSVMLDRDSVLSIPQRFRFLLDSDARMVAATPTHPLIFHKGDGRVYGQFVLNMPLQSGTLNLGNRGQLGLGSGSANLVLTSDIGTPYTAVIAIDLNLTQGTLVVSNQNTLNIADGHIKGDNIQVSESGGVSGSFTSLTANIAPSQFQVETAFSLTTVVGGRLTADDTSAPLTLHDGTTFPTGHLVLDLPFSRLANTGTVVLALTDGTAHLSLVRAADGTITGNDCSISGTLTVHSPDRPGTPGVDVSMPISVTQGKIGSSPRFAGVLNTTIPKAFSIAITTDPSPADCNSPNDDITYPVNVVVGLAAPLAITNQAISLTGAALVMPPLSLTASLTVQLPPGTGEHDPRQSCSNTKQDSDMQEVYSNHFDHLCAGFNCTVHIYLKPATYSASANLSLTTVTDGIQVSVSGIKTTQEVGWEKDGCGCIVGIAVCSLILPAAVCGGAFGVGTIIVNNKIGGLIEDKINGFSSSWKIKTN